MSALTSTHWADGSLFDSHGRARGSYLKGATLQYRTPATPTVAGPQRGSGKRKRITGNTTSTHPLESSPLAAPYVPHPGAQLVRPRASPSALGTPSPLVCENYRVAAGLETPGMSTAVMTMQPGDSPQLEKYRSSWQEEEGGDSSTRDPGPLRREANGKSRTLAQPVQSGRWAGSAFGLVGGVASFLFRMLPSLPNATAASQSETEDCNSSWHPSRTPLPGMYPEDYHNHQASTDYFNHIHIRPAKRLQLESGQSWVMVDREDEYDFSDRLSPRKISTTMSASLNAQVATTASHAGCRVPPAARPRLSTSYASLRCGSPGASPVHGHTRASTQHKRRASTASMRSPVRTLRPRRSQQNMTLSPRMSTPDLRSTPPAESEHEHDSLTPEAHRYLQRREKRDRDAERSMRKMSKQVQDLIRQGQLALGSNFEVDEEGGGDSIEL